MTKIDEYKNLILESFHARVKGDAVKEDDILDLLDYVWHKMSAEEKGSAEEWSRAIGKEYLDKDGNVIKSLPDRWT